MGRLTPWEPHPDALRLLDDRGGPFASHGFRACFVDALPEWDDVSFGARLVGGAEAAVAALRTGGIADSMPFNTGGVVATRALGETELLSFLHLARRHAGVGRLTVRWCTARPDAPDEHIGARVGGWTSVVHLRPGEHVHDRLGRKARRALEVAEGAGAVVVDCASADGFVSLYGRSSMAHWFRYPASLLRALTREGLARTFEVRLGDRAVSSVFVLTSPTRWTTWLAAQDPEGREIRGNYLATAAALQAASDAGVRSVDLGASTDMPGVALFKSRFDAVDVPVLELQVGSARDRTLTGLRRRSGDLRWAAHVVRRRIGV